MLLFFIARRHLSSRKSHSVINLTSVVSCVAIAVPVMALVVILSFHNGLSDFIERLYSEFDSDIRVTPRSGQTFVPTDRLLSDLAALPEVAAVSTTIEQQVLLTYSDRQWVAVMRGVDTMYRHVIPIESRIIQGRYQLRFGDFDRAVIGQGVAYALGVSTSLLEPLQLYAIRPGSGNPSFLPTALCQAAAIGTAGIYALDEQTDSRYIFVPLDFAQELLSAGNRISSLELRLRNGIAPDAGKAAVERITGPDFRVQTRLQQKETVYRMIAQEKWIIYLLLMFVVTIAALSLVGSVVMLATDKKRDRAILSAMGLSTLRIRNIFIWEGILITFAGVIAGLILGTGFALLQKQTGFIALGGDAFLMEAYPARILTSDLVAVAGGVLLLGMAVSYLTAASLIKKRQ